MLGEDGANAAEARMNAANPGPIRETKARSAKIFAGFSLLALAAIVGAVGSAFLANAGREHAPADRGVCWRAAGPSPPASALKPIERDVASLENCAAALEAWRLIDGQPALGAFQGYFIFVDAGEIASATTRRGFRYPVFQPAQRRAVDEGLADLIAKRNGALPAAADMVVERD